MISVPVGSLLSLFFVLGCVLGCVLGFYFKED